MNPAEVIFPHGPYRRPRASWLDTRLYLLAIVLACAAALVAVFAWGMLLARAATASLGGTP